MLHSMFGHLMRLRTSPSGHLCRGGDGTTADCRVEFWGWLNNRQFPWRIQLNSAGRFPTLHFRFAAYRSRPIGELVSSIRRSDFQFPIFYSQTIARAIHWRIRWEFGAVILISDSDPNAARCSARWVSIPFRFRFQFEEELIFQFQVIFIFNFGPSL